MANGQAPGTEADKGPKKPIMEQIREVGAKHGLDLSNDGSGAALVAGLGRDNPFAPEAPPAAATEAPPAVQVPAPPADTVQDGGTQPPGAAAGASPDPAPGAPGTGAPPAAGVEPPAVAPPAAPAPAGAAVVDSATGQPVVAPAEEWVDVEIEDPEAGRSFKARVLKGEEAPAKGGWLRRSDYTKKTQFLSRYKPLLEPMIASGEFEYVAPYLQRVTTDPAFAQAVVELYQQALQGQPLRYGVPAPAAPAAGGAAPSAAPAAGVDVKAELAKIAAENPDLDQYALEALGRAIPSLLGPVQERQKYYDQRFAQLDERATQEQRTVEQQRQVQQANRQFAYEAQAAFGNAYPQEFTGADTDYQKLGELYTYAQKAGYVQQYGPMGGLFAAKRAIDAAKAEYTPSAAAAAVQQRSALDEIEARSQQRAVADRVAAGLGGGAAGGAGGGTPSGPTVLTGAALRDKNGKLLPTNQIIRKFVQSNPT